MASHSLSLSHPALLAEYIRQSDLKTFFEQRLAAPPDHMALLIRNGEVIKAYKGAHFSVGGLVNGLKSIIGGATNVSILLADLKPFSLQLPVKALSKDSVEIAGVCTLELQVNPDKPSNVMGLMNPNGYLTREEVLERFRPHLTDRVFESAIGRVDADEIRGDKGLQDFIQGDIMREIERIAGNIGLIVNSVSMEWALNQVEREAMQAAQLEREQAQLDHQLSIMKRNVQRTADSREFQLRSDLEMATLANETEDTLAKMALNSEIEILDAREAAARRQELEAIQHEIEVFRQERVAKYQVDLDDASHTIDLTKEKAQLRVIERDIEDLDHLQKIEFRKREAEIKKFEAFSEQDVTQRIQQDTAANIRSLQDIEHSGLDKDSDRRTREEEARTARLIAERQADTDARIAQLNAGSKMTPEQIMAINAGLSSDVANVLAERARADSSGNQETMAIMREMVKAATDAQVRSEDQARAMFSMGMDGAVGVARGAGGGSGAPSDSNTPSSMNSGTVECPKCGREISAKARFCVGCGEALRT